MHIQDLPNPLLLKWSNGTSMPVDITGISAEDLVMTMEETTTHKKRKGNGRFVITHPRMGLFIYRFSEDDLAQEGEYALWFGRDDNAVGTYERFEMIVENRW